MEVQFGAYFQTFMMIQRGGGGRSAKTIINYPAWERYGCYWKMVPPQWGGGRIFDASAKFFPPENGHNSETKSQKIVPRIGNEPSLRGLQMGLWPKLGSYKNRIVGPKTDISGPKKNSLLNLNHVLAMTRQSCGRKKVPFSKIDITQILGVFWGKNAFSAKKPHFVWT